MEGQVSIIPILKDFYEDQILNICLQRMICKMLKFMHIFFLNSIISIAYQTG